MSLVYIQKKIKDMWRTILVTDSLNSINVYEHFCKQYWQHKFRISTDDMLCKPPGLSKDEALDVLCNIQFADLNWQQSRKVFERVVDVVEQVYKRYRR
jgi:hypothetical protein